MSFADGTFAADARRHGSRYPLGHLNQRRLSPRRDDATAANKYRARGGLKKCRRLYDRCFIGTAAALIEAFAHQISPHIPAVDRAGLNVERERYVHRTWAPARTLVERGPEQPWNILGSVGDPIPFCHRLHKRALLTLRARLPPARSHR